MKHPNPASIRSGAFSSALLLLFFTPAASRGQDNKVPYLSGSPWNTPVPAELYDRSTPLTPGQLDAIFPASRPDLTSDPNQYTYSVYLVDSTQADLWKVVWVADTYSNVTSETECEHIKGVGTKHPAPISVPIPSNAQQSPGTDGSIIFWDPNSGDEWAFWQLQKQDDGSYTATNGYHYNTHWSGVPPIGFRSRGAGVPYFAGLVRPWELAESGTVEHALAFAYQWPTRYSAYPATKSDGKHGADPNHLPEGARIVLDRSVDLDALGLSPEGKKLAQVLQTYGMIVIDNAGRSKIMVEDQLTARWGAEGNPTVTDKTIKNIPEDKLRLLPLSNPLGDPRALAPVKPLRANAIARGTSAVRITWTPAHGMAYHVKYRKSGDPDYTTAKSDFWGGWEMDPAWWATSPNSNGNPNEFRVDITGLTKGTPYEVLIEAVNGKGEVASEPLSVTTPDTLEAPIFDEGSIATFPEANASGVRGPVRLSVNVQGARPIDRVEFEHPSLGTFRDYEAPYRLEGFNTAGLSDGEHGIKVRVYYFAAKPLEVVYPLRVHQTDGAAGDFLEMLAHPKP